MEEAARLGHEEFVRMLIERGFDLSAPNTDRFSPLCEAVSSGSLPLVDYLIRHGANPCQVDDEMKHPAIHRAANEGHLEILKLLLEHGADPWKVKRVREGVSKTFERTAIAKQYGEIIQKSWTSFCLAYQMTCRSRYCWGSR
jgi:ankyrin repeat protein